MSDQAGESHQYCQAEREFLWAALRTMKQQVKVLSEQVEVLNGRERERDDLFGALTKDSTTAACHPRRHGSGPPLRAVSGTR